MKYYRLEINTTETDEERSHHEITKVMGIEPTIHENKKFPHHKFRTWSYCINEDENDPPYDFINNFLDLISPKFNELERIGINRNDISFWMIYEYDQQCGMEFHPHEMKRLGESGITMCIDCYQK